MCGPGVDTVQTRSGDFSVSFILPYYMYSDTDGSQTKPFSTPNYLQTHDKLLHTRHPKRDIISTRAREYVHVNGKRKLAIMICHRCTIFNTRHVSMNM